MENKLSICEVEDPLSGGSNEQEKHLHKSHNVSAHQASIQCKLIKYSGEGILLGRGLTYYGQNS